MNLGVKAYSIDSNQLAIFNQKSMLYLSQQIQREDINEVIRNAGKKVLERLRIYTKPFFPLRQKSSNHVNDFAAVGYLWTYSKKCKVCGYKFFLIKRPWLSKKKNRYLAFVVINGKSKQSIKIKKVSKKYEYPTVWINSSVKCPKCNNIEEHIDIKKCQDELIGVVYSIFRKGKKFSVPINNVVENSTKMDELEREILESLEIQIPQTELPRWSGIVNPALYGIKYHKDIFNQRQRIVMLLLIKSLYEEYLILLRDNNKKIADYVISILSSLIDQLVDWNCRISIWISQNEQVGRAFCGPGVPMYWDYVEIDPLLYGPANLWNKLKRILKAVNKIKKFPIPATIEQGNAKDLPFEKQYFDAIITDPPYYDNIYYSILADFFYIWKAVLIKKIDIELIDDIKTNSEDELVASSFRDGNSENTHKKYCNQLKLTFNEAARVLKKEGIFSFIYSHSSINAWKAIIQSYRHSEFIITSVQPLSIERKQRPRAMTSNAINTCIVFIARKISQDREIFKKEVAKEILNELMESEYTQNLINSGWSEKDIALAIFAHSIALLSNTLQKDGNDEDKSDEIALIEFKNLIKTWFPKFNITKRKSL
jgi:putative DNA methylase